MPPNTKYIKKRPSSRIGLVASSGSDTMRKGPRSTWFMYKCGKIHAAEGRDHVLKHKHPELLESGHIKAHRVEREARNVTDITNRGP